ncbi:hypothetical protein CBR_g41419 [Chara braunii]|uniref:Myb/SANT-like DNA-binding domain-containing protein n=1 Tax=Chara braunii TaxID=69332 RepID=A0A388LW28_CHABU|nr:hypothetical protein CBR_g41419 [Chara braunii]|eukprot:GBG86422.1 hypothetical protein CBR_g41419 [Chara braunii]
MRLSPASRSGPGTPPGRQREDDGSTSGAQVERHGRQSWADARQALRQAGADTITRGVQELHVDEGGEAAAEEPFNCDDVDDEKDCNSDELPDVRPLGRKARGGGASAKKGSPTSNRRNKRRDDDTGGSDGEGGRNFWSVGDTVTLVRAKRDQDLYFAGMGHNFGCMKTREWRWEDVRQRLVKLGVQRKAVACDKKWDNLMQQFKKVHKYQNLSGGKDYFKLASSARRSEGFSFVMDRSVFDEMEAMTKGDHTIHPKNFADTGAPGGVQMPAGAGLRGMTSAVRGEGSPSTKTRDRRKILDSLKKGRHVPKGKRLRPGEASGSAPSRIAQGWVAAAQRDDDDEYASGEARAEGTASAVRESDRQRSSDHSASKGMTTPPPDALRVQGRDTRTKKVTVVDVVDPSDDEPLEKRRLRTAAANTPGTPTLPRQPHPNDEGGSAQRVAARAVVAARGAAGAEAAGAAGARLARRILVGRVMTPLQVVIVGDGLPAPTIPRSVVMPKSSAKVARISDQSQLQQATKRATTLENVVMRILHGWVFKSGNRPRGYHLTFQYKLESFATDLARVMWCGEEWSNAVSAEVCAHTIDLGMDLPLWFVGASVDDRPDDDDMMAYQESTIICIAHAFRAAIQMVATIDGGFISYERLCRVADCFRLLLAASMWLMRMAGDDQRSHYEAFYFAKLVAKPTLVASMHRAFEHRKKVLRAVNVVTERLGKANATLGEYPKYIPDWADCGISFGHAATITGSDEAKKLGWLGSGPPDDDDGEADGKKET